MGDVRHYDHHFAPVLWFDSDSHLHVLYDCHGRASRHIVSEAPKTIDRWKEAPQVAESISYPRVLPLPDGRHLMYSRTFGHMGFWTYRLTEDGGCTWTDSFPLIDFDQNPQCNEDLWAGSYHSVELSRDGTSLHIGFVYFDERAGVKRKKNPLYGQAVNTNGRHHLYCASLDFDSGALSSIDGEPMPLPLTRNTAEPCKVLDTGHQLTNMPAIANDDEGHPCFLLPSTGTESPWTGHHQFVRREKDAWASTPVAPLNNTWDGNLLVRGKPGEVTAIVTTGDHDGGSLHYGGGTLEAWASTDAGSSWTFSESFTPRPGMICNNPKMVERSSGGLLGGYLTFFGWEGPGGLTRDIDKSAGHNRGCAYLWYDGAWL